MGTAAENKAASKRRLQEALNKTKNKNYNSFSGTVDKPDVNKENAAEIRKGNRTATVSDAINAAGFAAGPAIGGGKMLFGLGAKALSKFLPKGLLAKLSSGSKLSAKEIAQANKLKKLDAAKNNKIKVDKTKVDNKINKKPVGQNTVYSKPIGPKRTTGRPKKSVDNNKVYDKNGMPRGQKVYSKPVGPSKNPINNKVVSSGIGNKTKAALIGIGGAATGVGGKIAYDKITGSGNEVKKKVPTKKPITGNPGTGNEVTAKQKFTEPTDRKTTPKKEGSWLDKVIKETKRNFEGDSEKKTGRYKSVSTGKTNYKSDGGKIKMSKGYSKGGKIFTGR